MRFEPVLYICGIILTTAGFAMLAPATVDMHMGNVYDAKVFFLSSGITVFFGAMLILSNHDKWKRITVRETFLMTSLNWILVSAFSALPFCFSELQLSYTDAFFETMSGLTTTGSTILSGLDSLPYGLLLWRASLQWLGGIGIIVMAIAILPFLHIGGMQLFTTESSDNAGKTFPRVAQVVTATIIVYLVLSVLCAASLKIAGMSCFEAITHAMTTVSTGGYSTSDCSIGHFNSAAIEWVIIFFMTTGGMPIIFFLYIANRQWENVRNDSQVFRYLYWLAIIIAGMSVWLWLSTGIPYEDALRKIAFHVISLVTTTGFATDNYIQWGHVFVVAFFILTAVGGCTGSTAGGIKIFRFRILYLTAIRHFKTMLTPHGVFINLYNGKPVKEDVMIGVLVFITAFFFSVAFLTLILGCYGVDFVTSLSGALTAIANVGPGLGNIIGPAGNFSTLPDGAKWALSVGMLLGRLEFLTVFVLFIPAAWKN